MKRCFVALALPDATADALLCAQQALASVLDVAALRLGGHARPSVFDAPSGVRRLARDDLGPVPEAPSDVLDASPRWSTRANLHLTLKFLGQVSDDRLTAVCDALASIAAKSASLHVELLGLGVFGGPQPRCVYAAVGRGKAEALASMAATDKAMSALGFAPEQASRVPHVTLARLRKGTPAGTLGPWLAQQKPVAYGPLDGSAIVLYESVSHQDGVRYTPLSRWPLGNAPQ